MKKILTSINDLLNNPLLIESKKQIETWKNSGIITSEEQDILLSKFKMYTEQYNKAKSKIKDKSKLAKNPKEFLESFNFTNWFSKKNFSGQLTYETVFKKLNEKLKEIEQIQSDVKSKREVRLDKSTSKDFVDFGKFGEYRLYLPLSFVSSKKIASEAIFGIRADVCVAHPKPFFEYLKKGLILYVISNDNKFTVLYDPTTNHFLEIRDKTDSSTSEKSKIEDALRDALKTFQPMLVKHLKEIQEKNAIYLKVLNEVETTDTDRVLDLALEYREIHNELIIHAFNKNYKFEHEKIIEIYHSMKAKQFFKELSKEGVKKFYRLIKGNDLSETLTSSIHAFLHFDIEMIRRELPKLFSSKFYSFGKIEIKENGQMRIFKDIVRINLEDMFTLLIGKNFEWDDLYNNQGVMERFEDLQEEHPTLNMKSFELLVEKMYDIGLSTIQNTDDTPFIFEKVDGVYRVGYMVSKESPVGYLPEFLNNPKMLSKLLQESWENDLIEGDNDFYHFLGVIDDYVSTEELNVMGGV